ncbi:MAG: hypothetical protein DRP94_05940 [Candidatus Latescibacterota bacterium]|nr:MAG: hypothetical protein DRP94_05940 [Candidatus Latescibacterota bacterium]
MLGRSKRKLETALGCLALAERRGLPGVERLIEEKGLERSYFVDAVWRHVERKIGLSGETLDGLIEKMGLSWEKER